MAADMIRVVCGPQPGDGHMETVRIKLRTISRTRPWSSPGESRQSPSQPAAPDGVNRNLKVRVGGPSPLLPFVAANPVSQRNRRNRELRCR